MDGQKPGENYATYLYRMSEERWNAQSRPTPPEISAIRATAMDLLRQLDELEVKYLDTKNKRDGLKGG